MSERFRRGLSVAAIGAAVLFAPLAAGCGSGSGDRSAEITPTTAATAAPLTSAPDAASTTLPLTPRFSPTEPTYTTGPHHGPAAGMGGGG